MKRLVRCWGPCCAKLGGVAGCGVPAPGGPKRIMILRPILAVAAVCGLNGVLFEGRFSFPARGTAAKKLSSLLFFAYGTELYQNVQKWFVQGGGGY